MQHVAQILAPGILLFISTAGSGTVHAQIASGDEKDPPPHVTANVNDGLVVESTNGDLRFSLRNLARFRHETDISDSKVTSNGFSISMMRPQLRIAFWQKKIDIFIQPELAGPQARLLDAQFTFNASPLFSLRVGQFVTPMTRDFYTPVPLLLFPDFSIVNNEFRMDRDIGAVAFGTMSEGKFEYYLGAFDGQRLNFPKNDNTHLAYMGRVAVNPLGPLPYDNTIGSSGKEPFRFALAINAYNDLQTRHTSTLNPMTNQLVDVADTANPLDKSVVGGDAAFAVGPVAGLFEGFYSKYNPRMGPATNPWGAWGHTAVFVLPPVLQIAARASYLNLDRGAASRTKVFEALVQYYFAGNHLRLEAVYGATDPDAGPIGHRMLMQLQMF